MERTTQQEIQDKKQTAKADSLCDRVREAFANVTLGVGVGLFEGQAIDDYETDDIRSQKREKDEKEFWDRIETKHLNACYSSLSFFDPLGMRFHLPAFIIADLKGEYGIGLEFTLAHLCDYRRKQFELLNTDQRQTVREYLLFLRENADPEFDLPEIDRALNNFWKA